MPRIRRGRFSRNRRGRRLLMSNPYVGGYFKRGQKRSRYSSNIVHSFKRTFALDNITVVDQLNHHGYNFKLSDLPSYTEFTTLFDQYRIVGVKIKGMWSRNNVMTTSSGLGVAANAIVPLVYSVIDYDDATALTSLADYEQYQTLKMQKISQNIQRYIKPRIAMAAYGGGAFSSYANMPGSTWLDCSSATIEHYGYKLAIDGQTEGAGAGNVLGKLTLYATVYLQCRQVR